MQNYSICSEFGIPVYYWYRNREKEFFKYFEEGVKLVYCADVHRFMSNFNITCNKDEWRLFIDSSKRSLKAVLLHHGSKCATVPVGHTVHLKELYENLALVLNKIKYADCGLTVCGDLKVNKVDTQSTHVSFVSETAVIRLKKRFAEKTKS